MPASRAQTTRTAERRRQAVELRLAGAQWDAIAAALGYSDKAAACKDVTRAMERAAKALAQSADALLETELQRLDRLQRALWAEAINGDTKAADTVLKIIDKRVKLRRLDEPPDHELVMQQQVAARLSGQMAVVFAQVLDGLDLNDRQREMVPLLLQQAIGGFLTAATARPREIEGEVIDSDD